MTVTDVVVLGGLAVWSATVAWSWLWGYRVPRGKELGRGWRAFSLSFPGRAGVLLVFTAVFTYLCLRLWITVPLPPSAGGAFILRTGGMVVFVAGVGLYVWGRRAMGAIFAVSTSASVQLHADHRLIRSGPFALVRHPMYLGMIGSSVGLLVVCPTWAVVLPVLLFLVALPRRAHREEQALAEAFGQEWEAYARRVPRWFPRVSG